MRIIYISDIDFTGSGYSHITINLCQGLVKLGHEVIVVGLSYKNEQHPWDFSVIPAKGLDEVIATTSNLFHVWHPHVIITALDIPHQGVILDRISQLQLPYIAITPLESGPLCMQWTMSLMRATKLFLISQYGAEEVIKKGVEAEHLQIGIDTVSWKKRTKREYKEARRQLFGIEDDTFIILTVADNQERKNLAGAMHSISIFKERMGEDFRFRYTLVTRPGAQVGWKLSDLAIRMDIMEEYVEFERGLSFARLWLLYACADAFFLASKGEGLGLPVMEAMAVGVPVVASAVGAITEHLSDNRGYLIPHEYEMIDPYGNADRYYMNRELAADALELIVKGEGRPKAETRVKKARAYVETRTWDKSVSQLDEAIRSLVDVEESPEEIQTAAAI
jgi:glycosyltransferase involved in cell wall biosynthesis